MPQSLATSTERWIQEQEHELYPDKPRHFFKHTNCRGCGPGPLGRDEIPSEYDHVWYGEVEFTSEYGHKFMARSKVKSPSEADVVSSELESRPGWHTPMIDIDLRSRLITSSTNDHYHLFIDYPMPWRVYKRLLRAMVRAGIVEKGFYKASVKRKATHLRPPWREKQ